MDGIKEPADEIYEDYSFYEETENFEDGEDDAVEEEEADADEPEDEEESGLPQCKIKRNYACTECSFFTQNPRTYLYHLKEEHKKKLRVYECPHCIYASKHSQKLHRHLQMVHSGDKKKAAVKKVVKTKQYLPPVDEYEDKDDELPESTGEGKNKMYKCPTCPFTSKSHILVMRHEKVVHLKKKFFRCAKCNYVTHMKARFTKHVKYHSMPMIKCDMCDFKTPYKWNLDRHLKNHSGNGAFKCTVCSFTADIKQSLTVHEMNHHVPPVMGHVTPNKRKNRVGASDLQPPSPPPPPEHMQMHAFNELSFLNEIEITKKLENPSHLRKPPGTKKPNAYAQFSPKELTMKIGEKLVSPNDVLQQKNGTVYVKKLKCRVCSYRSAWDSEMVRHEQRVHGIGLEREDKKSSQKGPRPIPNLIPIPKQPPGPPPPLQPSMPPHPPPHHSMLSQPPRPMMMQKQLMQQLASPPQYPPSMGRYPPPFPPQHIQHQLNLMSHPHTPHTHNLPPSYAQQLPSRFAQPKNIMQKLKRSPYPMGDHMHPKQLPPKPSPPPPPILKIPTPTKTRTSSTPPSTNSTPDKTMTEKDLNDICAKSCPTSSLKDFASLMGGDEYRPERDNVQVREDNSDVITVKSDKSQDSVSEDGPKSPEGMKKKNSFFDQLKEKFSAGESCNLICNICGHESKCLSESLRHQKTHKAPTSTSGNGGNFSNADLSSTRCQYCRQRCKTSADLLVHLKSCTEANKANPDTINLDEEEEEDYGGGEFGGERMDFEEGEGDEEYQGEEGYVDGDGQNPHPMENKVFVWTNMANGDEDGLDDEYECGSQSPNSDCVFGIETAPGIGAVTSKNKTSTASFNSIAQSTPPKEAKPKPDVKKVYKCPHCSFWASTASRFHVHIVGHLNKKPFECSLCCYRSNWRWDITKHIRLKTMRDSTHQRAKVLMTDETGRRNYSKYNKYLTLMRVHEPNAESGGLPKGKKMTQSFEPIETVPPLPKLTPAPQASLQGEDGGASTPNRVNPSKPPPLQPSNELKRKALEEAEDEPTKKKGLAENKKTMWKCKKCLFRDSDRAVVLAHVKGHYRNTTTQGAQAATSDSSDEASSNPPFPRGRWPPEEGLPYKCGHCPQTSQWKHVIQRHCRLKHNGNVSVILAPRSSTDSDKIEDNNEPDTFMCETCPFVGTSQQSMDDHMEKHFESPDASLKCYFCPFFVSDKEELMEHISLHGEPETDDNNYSTREEDSSSMYSSGGENGDPLREKRYRCTSCPYSSNSKTQFLYHKQFHRPRGAPFQCHMCSYNVPRRHFLQQHLRLHGINTPLPKIKGAGTGFIDTEANLNIKEIDTSNMTEIPLVWVSKLGSLTKMFKCRYCPHVNIRKSNIQEHEKMHGIRTKPNPEGSSPIPQQQHHCPECNYICNNAGVLSSHQKVHQGLFGQVCALVDLNRKDEDQIKELNTMLGREEEGPPEIMPDEINKDFKESQTPLNQTPEKENSVDNRVLHFCSICPARFLYPKELEIHLRFHSLQLQFQCDSCSYTARQQPHLLAHYKVHTDEYQDRTTALCEVYQISEEHPKPKIAVIVDGSEEVGPAWVVVERQTMPAKDPQNEYDLDEAPSEFSQHGNRIVTKQFACEKCPATFFKSVALQYHIGLHGGPGPNKCRVCDYAVKTYGNLIKHEAVHEELEPRVKKSNKNKKAAEFIPTSGTELFKQKTEANQKVASAPPPPPPLHIDPEFGILMHGSPEFVYPTYLKNGRLKEKRYKCHKCPSAFEKREQYKVHLSLHGSKQRYSCERCDYSVKYYANYIQHLKKHQSNDVSKAERKSSTEKNGEDSLNDDGSESTYDPPVVEEIKPQPPITAIRSAKKMQISMADQQTMMLMQQRVIGNSTPAAEVTNRCPHCPYSNQRKEGVGSHVKCHNNAKGGAYACKYCNYTVPQQHFLRDHNKLHFQPLRCNRPEAFMKFDRLELWSEPVPQNKDDDNSPQEKSEKVLIFKDRGVNTKENRFLPEFTVAPVDAPMECDEEKIYINIKTGEPETNTDSADNSEKEDDDKENNTGDLPKEEVKVVDQEASDEKVSDKEKESQILQNQTLVKEEEKQEENSPVEDQVLIKEEDKREESEQQQQPCEEELLGNDNEILENFNPMEVDEDQLLLSPNSVKIENTENPIPQEEEDENSAANDESEHFQTPENSNMEVSDAVDNLNEAEIKKEEVGLEAMQEGNETNFADQESQDSNVNDENNVTSSQALPDSNSNEEVVQETEASAAVPGSIDSDSEDSSSDSSSSSDSNESDSTSTSITSSQQS